MLVQACKNFLRIKQRLAIPLYFSFATTPASTFSPLAVSVSRKKLNTQVFSKLSYQQLSNPRYTKALIIKPIHNHSRVSQRSLFHKKRVSGRILTCFSEKKHKVFRRVNKMRRIYYSDILGSKISIVLSSKAFKTINKMGTFDNYILCTKPKDLDSKYGEYLRELMLRKINDQDFRVPYIIGTNRKLRVKKYQRHLYIQSLKKLTIPKSFKDQFRTFQNKFGKSIQQLNNEDYSKYVQLQNIRKKLGQQLEPTHPLLLQLKQKLKFSYFTQQQQKKMDQMSRQAEQNYVNDPKFGQANRKHVEKIKHELQMLNLKSNEIKFKMSQDLLE